MNESYDVIVLGLGAMGSAAAYHLARRGRRVLGLEQFTAAHDRGSSHGGSRIIRQAYFEDPAYVPLVLRAYELWRDVEQAAGTDLLTITGALMIGAPDSEPVAGSLRSARHWGLDHEVLDAGALRRRFPAFAPDPDTVALHEPQAGVLRPEAAVAAHLRLAAAAGAELRFSEPVVPWNSGPAGGGVPATTDRVPPWTADPAGGGVSVRSTGGVVRAHRLVVCPGAWAPDLLADLGVALTVERQVQFWFEPAGGVEPFRPGRFPVWLWDDGGDRMFYGVPALDGPDGGIKAAWHRAGRRCHPDTLDRTVSAAEVEELAATLRRRVPALPGRFLRAAPCMYTLSPDQHFVVAAHPADPQVLVACGFSGHGFKFAPVIGEIVADLVAGDTTPHPIALFDPRRFTDGVNRRS